MNVEELSKLTEAELRARANVSLHGVETMSAMEKQNRLVEAQFYIDEIERRAQAAEREEHSDIAERDRRIADRDYKLELWVIVLIGIEIGLSIVGLVTSHIEAGKQAAVLDRLRDSVVTLNRSTSQTAENIGTAYTVGLFVRKPLGSPDSFLLSTRRCSRLHMPFTCRSRRATSKTG